MIWTLQTVFGRFFDAMVGQVMDALGGGSRSSPWSSPRDRAPRRDSTPGSSADGSAARETSAFPAAPSVPVWEPARGISAAAPAAAALDNKDLRGDDIKLVRYALLSLDPCHERILPDGTGEVVVRESMTAESFATWIVAIYLQSDGHEIPHGEKKYLRVNYEVLARWPSEPKDCCEDRKLGALEGIRDALHDVWRRTRGTEAPPASETEPPETEPPSASLSAAAPKTPAPAPARKPAPAPTPALTPAPTSRQRGPAKPETKPAEDRGAAKKPSPPPRHGGRSSGPTRKKPR